MSIKKKTLTGIIIPIICQNSLWDLIIGLLELVNKKYKSKNRPRPTRNMVAIMAVAASANPVSGILLWLDAHINQTHIKNESPSATNVILIFFTI
jgi:hypothetical protein